MMVQSILNGQHVSLKYVDLSHTHTLIGSSFDTTLLNMIWFWHWLKMFSSPTFYIVIYYGYVISETIDHQSNTCQMNDIFLALTFLIQYITKKLEFVRFTIVTTKNKLIYLLKCEFSSLTVFLEHLLNAIVSFQY